jgi:hypothetical protein
VAAEQMLSVRGHTWRNPQIDPGGAAKSGH